MMQYRVKPGATEGIYLIGGHSDWRRRRRWELDVFVVCMLFVYIGIHMDLQSALQRRMQ